MPIIKKTLVAACALVSLAAAPSAHAACAGQVFSQPFSAWNDTESYTLVPGGDFEHGLTAGWILDGTGGKVVADNNKYSSGPADQYSLELPTGASVTTPPICVGAGYPTSRLFANTVKHVSSSGSTLQVEVLYTDATRGGQTAKKLGTAPDEYGWDAARKMSLAQGQLNIKPDSDGNTYVRYRFTPLYGTTWRLDDVYVDPRMW